MLHWEYLIGLFFFVFFLKPIFNFTLSKFWNWTLQVIKYKKKKKKNMQSHHIYILNHQYLANNV